MASFVPSMSRRAVMLGATGAALSAPFVSRPAFAAVPNIRYATGGGIGPNEMETIIFLDYVKQNVLKNYGKAYTLDMTFTRGTPELFYRRIKYADQGCPEQRYLPVNVF